MDRGSRASAYGGRALLGAGSPSASLDEADESAAKLWLKASTKEEEAFAGAGAG